MPQDGDFMVTATGGWVAWCIRKITRSKVNHAAVYVGNGLIVEARPQGAWRSLASEYPRAVWSKLPLTAQQRHDITKMALDLVGTPYSFADIAVQALVRLFGWHAPNWVLKRLSRPDRLQCAQLVDYCYHVAGVELFSVRRPIGLVSPGDLLDVAGEVDH